MLWKYQFPLHLVEVELQNLEINWMWATSWHPNGIEEALIWDFKIWNLPGHNLAEVFQNYVPLVMEEQTRAVGYRIQEQKESVGKSPIHLHASSSSKYQSSHL